MLKEKIQERLLLKSDKVIDNLMSIADVASQRFATYAEAQMGETGFRVTFASLIVLINDVYQDVKTMGSPRYRNIRAFQDYARGALVNYYMILDDAEAASEPVNRMRGKIMDGLGAAIDKMYVIGESKPRRKGLLKRGPSQDEIDAFRKEEYGKCVPEITQNLINFCMDMNKALSLATTMSAVQSKNANQETTKPGGE